MVEPVPYVFERLRRNYAHVDRVTLENAAISDHDGLLTFYFFEEAIGSDRSRVPEQYHLLGSASRDVLLRHIDVPDRERRIVSEQLPCMTFDTLCRRHAIERIDVLVVDAEGHDCKIVRQMDFARLRPRILAYEDVHAEDAERAGCEEMLTELGYEMMREGFDTWCVDTRPDDALTRKWREVRRTGPAVRREDLERWFAAVTGERR